MRKQAPELEQSGLLSSLGCEILTLRWGLGCENPTATVWKIPPPEPLGQWECGSSLASSAQPPDGISGASRA